jgi:acyl-CoA thioesterase FadM
MSNISVIIPIHEFNEDISKYLDKAIESIIKQEKINELPKIVIVYAEAIEENIINYKDSLKFGDKLDITLLKNEGKTDYQSQVNLAVKSIEVDYFSVLEFDDEYAISYFKNVEQYIKTYKDIDVFLTIIIESNEKNEAMKFANETVWAQQFVGENGEIGYLNINVLKQYSDFKLSGAVIKKSEFLNIGGYKSNILLTFMYEFLLRAVNNGCKIFTIPKLGYKHIMNRSGSLFDGYLKSMPMPERKFWFETAHKESNFTNDRIIDTSKITKIV